MFVGAGALAAGAVGAAVLPATAASAATSSAGSGRGLAGGWMITRRDEGASSSVKSLVTFADGGALATVDLDPAAPADIGAWVDAGDSHFRAEFWIPATGPQGSPLVRVRPRGRWWADHIQGSYAVAGFVGGKEVFTSSGTFHGTRIEP
jgi:hypothetical protein